MMIELKRSLLVLGTLTLLTGILYPLLVTGLAQVAFPDQAGGSLIHEGGQAKGSALIGQPFDDPRYFWSRPSATSPFPFNAAASSGSNLSPSNPALVDAVTARIAALHQADPSNRSAVPIDLVTASASGLDPDISPAAAEYQAPRIARSRNLSLETVRRVIRSATTSQTFGFLGEARVNVLKANLALDRE